VLRYLNSVLGIFAARLSVTGAPLKCEVSTSKPVTFPHEPSLIMHLERSSVNRDTCIDREDVSPVIGGVMSPGFPSAVKCSVLTELSFQTWRWLRQPIVSVVPVWV
jgi:hypothetical protein